MKKIQMTEEQAYDLVSNIHGVRSQQKSIVDKFKLYGYIEKSELEISRDVWQEVIDSDIQYEGCMLEEKAQNIIDELEKEIKRLEP